MRTIVLLLCVISAAISAKLPYYNYLTPGSGTVIHGGSGGSSGSVINQVTPSGTFVSQGTSSGSFAGSHVAQGILVGASGGHGTSSGSGVTQGVSYGPSVSQGTSFASTGSVSGTQVTSLGTVSTSGGAVGTVVTALSQGITTCREGQVLHVDGRCVTPKESQRLFVYDVPANVHTTGAVNIPEPEVHTNVILIRAPTGVLGQEPIVVPPPRQNNVVYILNKRTSHNQGVIHVPAPQHQEPEVYFVNYAEGENPTLPNGVDLHTAIHTAAHGHGQTVGSIGFGGVTGAVGGVVTTGGQVTGSVGTSGFSGGQVTGSVGTSGFSGGQVTGSVGTSGFSGGQVGYVSGAGSTGGHVSGIISGTGGQGVTSGVIGATGGQTSGVVTGPGFTGTQIVSTGGQVTGSVSGIGSTSGQGFDLVLELLPNDITPPTGLYTPP